MTTLDLVNTTERTILDLSLLGLPGLKVLGRYDYKRPHPALPSHAHADMMEICYLHRGRQKYEVEERDYLLNGGDLFLTFPGEQHSTGPEPEDRGVLYWLILRVRQLPRNFLGYAGDTANILAERLMKVPTRHFRAPARTRTLLERLFQFYTLGIHDPLTRMAAGNQLSEFLFGVINAAEKDETAKREKWLTAVLQYMENHLEEPLQVPDFAVVAGLSVSHFKSRFREALGAAPAEYFLTRRINRAQELLANTHSPVTRIAHDLGFGTSQSFATAFRRLTGRTPSQFRAEVGGDPVLCPGCGGGG